MPPITNQGSRTGLITAVVVFTILFVVATIFAIYYSVQAQNSQQEYLSLKSTVIPRFLPEGATTDSPLAKELDSAKNSNQPGITPNMPLMQVAVTERNNLAAAIDPAVPASGSLPAVRNSLTQATTKLNKIGVTLPSNQQNLIGAVNALSTAVINKQQTIDQLQKQVSDAQAALQSKTTELTVASQALEATAKQIRGEATQQEANVTTYRGEKEAQVTDIEAAHTKERTALQEQVTKLNGDVAAKTTQVAKLQDDIRTLQNKLGARRVDATEATIRHADGQILRLGTGDILYINLGSNQHVIPGLTFEVYDRRTGIPALSTGANQADSDQLVKGKASVEVIRVESTTSECRVISRDSTKPPIQEGDLLGNLVYDPNTTYSFYIFGKFDLDHNGVATINEGEVVKRLVTQWGGTLATDINVNTDFVVLGAEPVVPNLSKDDESNPILVQNHTQAEADLKQYTETINKARDLHIPILNQNRFLYFIGYYDQAKK